MRQLFFRERVGTYERIFNFFAAELPYDPTVKVVRDALLDEMMTQLVEGERIFKRTEWGHAVANFFGAWDMTLGGLTDDLNRLQNRMPERDYELIKRCLLCIHTVLPVLESV